MLTNKVVKDFMLQTLNDIDIRGSASKDPAYASQTREAILSAVYSKNKDQCCNLLISKGINIAPFLQEIGEAAKKMQVCPEQPKMTFLRQAAQGPILL